jgi:hypothetical protein
MGDAKFVIINFDILKNFHMNNKKIKKEVIIHHDLVNANFDLCIIDAT